MHFALWLGGLRGIYQQAPDSRARFAEQHRLAFGIILVRKGE